MTEEEAKAEEKKGNYVTYEEGKGYRRIIASPKPMDIYELDAIKALLDAGQIVIACGGGGIPVLQQGARLKGASAIIEKDLASAKLAELLDADTLLFLTGVEKVCKHYGTAEEEALDVLTLDDTQELISEGHFTSGSMLPKVQAAASFVALDPKHKAIIADLKQAKNAVRGKSGTQFK